MISVDHMLIYIIYTIKKTNNLRDEWRTDATHPPVHTTYFC